MFEREVKFIYDFNSNKVKKLGPSATFAELLPIGIHPAILQYISAEIEFRVFEDRQTLLKHSMFDYSGSLISKHFQKIADEIKKEKRFSTDFISKVILHATSFNVNYLIRPNWSLKKLIFDTSESNNVAEILQILNYAYFYKHITKVVRNYLDKKKLISLDKQEFSDLLTKFDKVSIDAYGNDVLESAIKAMSSFFNIGSMKQNTVPLQGIAVFLQEKKLIEHIELIQKNIDGDIKGKIEVNDLRSILFNVKMQRTEVMDEPKETEEEKLDLETEVIEPKGVENEIDEIDKEVNEEEQQDEQEETSEKTSVEEKGEVEIKLRENKEKEVSEIEEEPEPLEEVVNKDANKELLGIDEESEELEKELPEKTEELKTEVDEEVVELEDEESEEIELNEEHINEAAEYLVDQTDNPSDEIILTVEDEEKYKAEHNDEIDNLDDAENETLNDEDSFEKEPEEEKEESLAEDVYTYGEDEYSYPADRKSEDEQIREDDFEEVDELELAEDNDDSIEAEDEKKSDEIFEQSDDETEEESKTEDEVDPTIEENELDDHEVVSEDVEEENSQATLFGDIPADELIGDTKPEEDFIEQYSAKNHIKKIDIADLLENKNMTKIIAVVFDYDMEEFANAVEKICDSETSQEAFGTLQEIFELNQVNPSSREAQAFREIISEYFEQE